MENMPWGHGELGSTVEVGWLSAWIEPLLGEGEGRFSWSVDTPARDDREVLLNLDGGVEPTLNAAMEAATAAIRHFGRAELE